MKRNYPRHVVRRSTPDARRTKVMRWHLPPADVLGALPSNCSKDEEKKKCHVFVLFSAALQGAPLLLLLFSFSIRVRRLQIEFDFHILLLSRSHRCELLVTSIILISDRLESPGIIIPINFAVKRISSNDMNHLTFDTFTLKCFLGESVANPDESFFSHRH